MNHQADIIDQKKQLRKAIKGKLAIMSDQERYEKSMRILEKLEQQAFFAEQTMIMAYWSFQYEVDTHPFVQKWYKSKRIFLPCIKNDTLEVVEYTGIECMQNLGSHGIMEPAGDPIKHIDEIGLIIVPGLAFDLEGRRLGRGKAYYDRFLNSTKAIRAAVCFRSQIVDRVPSEPHDLKMNHVIFD